MKDYFLRDGGKLKKFGFRKIVRSVFKNLLKKIVLNPIKIIIELTADLEYEETSKLFNLVQIKIEHPNGYQNK